MKNILITLITLASAVALAQQMPAGHEAAKQAIKQAAKQASQQTKKSDDKVFFVEPKDGATVGTTFEVKMGVEGMKVCPAGKATTDKKCGHHHIIVDGAFMPEGTVIPSDATHIHFGKAQTEGKLTLAPGPHTLTLQFADFAHRSYGEKLSSTIHITVK
jgi:hypothetical protein